MLKKDITIMVTVPEEHLDEVWRACEQWMNTMHEVYGTMNGYDINVDACIDTHKEDKDV